MASSKSKAVPKMIKIGSLDPRDCWYRITPEVALALLNGPRPKNRGVRPGVSKTYGLTMKAHQWVKTGQAVILDYLGRLLDGQQRLTGCVQSNTPFDTVVIHLPKTVKAITAFDAMDQGIPRSVGDRFAALGIKYPYILGPAVRAAMAYDKGVPKIRQKVGLDGPRLHYKNNKERWDAAAEFVMTRKHADTLGFPKSALVMTTFYVCAISKTKGERFIEGLITGDMIAAAGPVARLRRILAASLSANKEHKLNSLSRHSCVVAAWKLYLAGKTKGRIKVKADGDFPVFGTKKNLGLA